MRKKLLNSLKETLTKANISDNIHSSYYYYGLLSVGAFQKTVYRHKISDIDKLKCVVIDCWAQLNQDTLNPCNRSATISAKKTGEW